MFRSSIEISKITCICIALKYDCFCCHQIFCSPLTFAWHSCFSFWKCFFLSLDLRYCSWARRAIFFFASVRLLMTVFAFSVTISRMILHSTSTVWIVDWIRTKFQIYFGFKGGCSVRVLEFWGALQHNGWCCIFFFFFFTNGDSHACGQNAMICLAVVDIKDHFGDEDISFVLYECIVYQMPVVWSGIHPCGLEASWKSEL